MELNNYMCWDCAALSGSSHQALEGDEEGQLEGWVETAAGQLGVEKAGEFGEMDHANVGVTVEYCSHSLLVYHHRRSTLRREVVP